MAAEGSGKAKLDALNAQFGDGIVIDPASVAGSRADTAGGTDAGDGGNGGSGGDDFARDDDGNIIRNADGSARRKPGRKPGGGSGRRRSGKRSASKENTSGIDGLQKILYSLHMGLAGMLKSPHWALDQDEARALAGAMDDVQRFYAWEASAEVLLWANVIGTCSAVYGPRIALSLSIAKKEAKKKPDAPRAAEPAMAMPLEGFDIPHHAPAE